MAVNNFLTAESFARKVAIRLYSLFIVKTEYICRRGELRGSKHPTGGRSSKHLIALNILISVQIMRVERNGEIAR